MNPPEAMRKVVEAGRTGRKGRSGFYVYDDKGEKGAPDETIYALIGKTHRADIPANEITERCVLAMVNEAVLCLEEGVLRTPRDGDIGAVFGLGFPPFRGGPFRYVDTVGADVIVARLEDLHARFPGRFSPARLLVEHARAQRRFHSGRQDLL
jgi:3-hydroxyacyl-CoA dehydrogenase/enoyl-CoA hydratase/3-hydroxybutyryl-CoA epimerase